jgi:two-component system chemotaxis response regulator CheB
MPERKIRVLVVDDSELVREILIHGLSQDPDIEVVGGAEDPYQASDLIKKHRPDVLTLDVEMPKMNGIDFLKRLMVQHPLPVVMVSAYTEKGRRITLEALEAGAVDFVAKNAMDLDQGVGQLMAEVVAKVKIAAMADVSHWKNRADVAGQIQVTSAALARASHRIIAIGASTGGPDAIRRVLHRFPANMPGVVIVQHMPPEYTQTLAERLTQVCPMKVREAKNGDIVTRGVALIAPGGLQTSVVRTHSGYMVYCLAGEKVSGHCPSVDVMMDSVAKSVGADAVGVLLTGMGSDGAQGMLALRQTGARTLAQDEATSVVYGMPREAYENGGAERLLPLDDIAPAIIDLLVNPKNCH